MGPRGSLPPPRPTPAPGRLPEGIARGADSRAGPTLPLAVTQRRAPSHTFEFANRLGVRGLLWAGGGLCSRCLPGRHSSRNPETWRAWADAITLGEGAPPLRGPGDPDTAGLILTAWPHLVFFFFLMIVVQFFTGRHEVKIRSRTGLWSPHEPFRLLPRRPGNSFLLQTLQLSPGLPFPS